jgi:hypothetical protein
MEHKSLTDQIGNKCRYFNGLMHNVCDAGIAYQSVQNHRERPLRLPCLKEDGCTERCPKASFLSAEEIAEKEAEIREAAIAFFRDMQSGLCPHCRQPVQKQVQVGRCVYAEPCGHRLWQGEANQAIEDHSA